MIRDSNHPFRTITADNGTEFHGFRKIEETTGIPFYFATPHHFWERGLNENTNGLIRQYLLKKESMSLITEKDRDEIAVKLNRQPRKTLKFKTPNRFMKSTFNFALQSQN